MALNLGLAGAGTKIRRYTTRPAAGAYTFAGWFNFNSGQMGALRAIHGRDGSTRAWYLGVSAADKLIFVRPGATAFSGVTAITGATTLVADKWYYVALAGGGTDWTLYLGDESSVVLNTEGSCNASTTVTSSAAPGANPTDNDRLDIAAESLNGYFGHCHTAYVRVWESTLTKTNLEAELVSATPVIAAWASYRLQNSTNYTTDGSGNSRALDGTSGASITASNDSTDPTLPSAATGPTISVQPANQTVAEGATASFSVTATASAGGGSLSYQWKKNGTNISGATSSSYTTPASTIGDTGAVFSVAVTDSNGTRLSSNAVLTVTGALPYVRERLISKSGAAQASLTGLTVHVWRGVPTGNPSQVLTGQTTDASGNTNWLIDRGTLAVGDPVWIMVTKDGTPARAGARKITPVYV